jgi:hypothetical protein
VHQSYFISGWTYFIAIISIIYQNKTTHKLSNQLHFVTNFCHYQNITITSPKCVFNRLNLKNILKVKICWIDFKRLFFYRNWKKINRNVISLINVHIYNYRSKRIKKSDMNAPDTKNTSPQTYIYIYIKYNMSEK